MKSLLALNLPKSSFGRIVRFFEPGSTDIITSLLCILFVFNSATLLSPAS